MNDDRPLPKSSSAKWQPRALSSRMKYTTLPKLAIAAVSVISKHIAPAANSLLLSSAIRYSRKRSSLSEVPERLTTIANALPPPPNTIPQPIECLANHPPIDRRHDVVALRRRNEFRRRHQSTRFVPQAQHQLEVFALVHGRADGHDGLVEELEPAFIAGPRQLRDPMH